MKQIKQYMIKEEIGRGGMSTVYRAYVEDTEKEVALKLMRESLIGDEQAQTRFIQEVQTVIGLGHPAIAPILDYGLVDGRLYLVMDYMAGGSVRQLLKTGPLSLAASMAILQQVALALDAAHAQNIIHRDVKPHNILLDEAGRAYLSDFGIARSMDTDGPGKTITLIGTPEYVAPEQVVEGQLTNKTDIYQLGVSLFQMLTGQLPFSGSSYQIMSHHLNDPLPSAEALTPQLPVGCDAVLRRATAKIATERYASAGDLAEAFATLLEPITGTQAFILPLPTQGNTLPLPASLFPEREQVLASAHTSPAFSQAAKNNKRSPLMRRAMALAVGGALLGGIFMFSVGGPPPPPPPVEDITQLVVEQDKEPSTDLGLASDNADVPLVLETVPNNPPAINPAPRNDRPGPRERGLNLDRVAVNNTQAAISEEVELVSNTAVAENTVENEAPNTAVAQEAQPVVVPILNDAELMAAIAGINDTLQSTDDEPTTAVAEDTPAAPANEQTDNNAQAPAPPTEDEQDTGDDNAQPPVPPTEGDQGDSNGNNNDQGTGNNGGQANNGGNNDGQGNGNGGQANNRANNGGNNGDQNNGDGNRGGQDNGNDNNGGGGGQNDGNDGGNGGDGNGGGGRQGRGG